MHSSFRSSRKQPVHTPLINIDPVSSGVKLVTNCKKPFISHAFPAAGSFRKLLFPLLLFVSVCTAQTVRFIPDSADAAQIWRINSSTELFIGASFYYMNPEDSIIAWCDTSETTGKTGELYVMVPGYADSALFLFTNRQQGTRVNISALLGTPIPVRTEIFFMYRLIDSVNSAAVTYTRYTGQNRIGFDPQDQTHYPGASFVTRDFGLKPGYGHRWAVAGRVSDNNGVPSDTLVFGFEDGNYTPDPTQDSLFAADFDFNDVIFRVTGLHLNVELIPDSLTLTVSGNPTPAGDTVRCTAAVWSDSAGNSLRTPKFDSLLHWELSGTGNNHDSLVQLNNNDSTALFIGKTSGTTCRLRVWFINPFSGDTVSATRTLEVIAGKPATLSIELRADTAASGFSMNHAVPANEIQIASNLSSRPVYALWRDAFGNFAGFSSATQWDTLTAGQSGMTPGIAVAENGDSTIGEGVIRKTGSSGTILVAATDTTGGTSYSDSITVSILGALYDSLRLLVHTGSSDTPVSSLSLSTDTCSNLVVQGHRPDNNTWETIDVEWDFSSPWDDADEDAPRSGVSFCPEDTGTGTVTLVHTAFVTRTIPVKVVAGKPVRLVLYHNKRPLPGDTTAVAGEPFDCSVRLFDRNGIWRSEYSLLTSSNPLVRRTIEQSTITDTLDSTGSFINMLYFDADFLPLRAHRTVHLIAKWKELTDTCTLSVEPGPPYRVVIEPDGDWERTPNAPHPVDTAEIPDTRTSIALFAILRDSLGNYVDSLRSGSWESEDTIVSVSYGSPACEAIVTKNIALKEGLTRITVISSDSAFTDFAWVRLLPYHFIRLRITSTQRRSIDSLTCSTNDDTTIIAQALRSDTALWREVKVNWNTDSATVLSPVPPRGSARYSFNPQKTGTGWISAVLSSDKLTDTLRVRFTRGKPLWASVQLLTPEEDRIAGDTLFAVVKIFNRPGLLEGTYCFPDDASDSVVYIDSLGTGGRSNKPIVRIGNQSVPLRTPGSTRGATRQCFNEGLDTIAFILYYAPADVDSLHRLQFTAGDLSAASAPFRLLPGDLASLRVMHPKSSSSRDSLFLQAPDESAILTAAGFDRFGNACGEQPSRWSVSGSLHTPADTGSRPRITYLSTTIEEDELGYITAAAASDTTISGKLRISIRGPLATALSAITRDTNGNGLIDRIDVTLSLPVTLRNAGTLAMNTMVVFNGNNLSIDRITSGSTATEIRILLREPTTAPVPQSGWTPQLTIDNFSQALDDAADSLSVLCSDGAGPVIWSVTKELLNADNRKQDRVTVVFSEMIYGSNGRKLPLSQSPEKLFDVWTRNSNNYLQQDLLDGISGLYAVVSPDTLIFTMKNGKDLTNLHYFSLHWDTTKAQAAPVNDLPAGNRSARNNQKVRVTVTGEPTGKLLIGPNPMRPTARRQTPGKISVRHNSSAIDWVQQDHAGTVFQFKVALPNDKKTKLAGKITIYDFVGNRVIADPVSRLNPMGAVRDDEAIIMNNEPRKNLLPSSWSPNGSVYDYNIYWNGFSLGGMPVAPGIYRVVLKLVISSSEGKETRTYSNTVGVKR